MGIISQQKKFVLFAAGNFGQQQIIILFAVLIAGLNDGAKWQEQEGWQSMPDMILVLIVKNAEIMLIQNLQTRGESFAAIIAKINSIGGHPNKDGQPKEQLNHDRSGSD